MIANIHPGREHYEDSYNTIMYARHACGITIEPIVRTVDKAKEWRDVTPLQQRRGKPQPQQPQPQQQMLQPSLTSYQLQRGGTALRRPRSSGASNRTDGAPPRVPRSSNGGVGIGGTSRERGNTAIPSLPSRQQRAWQQRSPEAPRSRSPSPAPLSRDASPRDFCMDRVPSASGDCFPVVDEKDENAAKIPES